MEITYIERDKTKKFSENALLLQDQTNRKLNTFINRPFSLTNFKSQLTEKSVEYTPEKRSALAQAFRDLYAQNDSLDTKKSALIQQLHSANTFTVTTGHQLSLYTGPLFFIYKIFHIIKLAEKLTKIHPESNFIPVFWMASEDHDFEEIQSIQVFNNTYTWESKQIGAVGRFHLDDFNSFKAAMSERFSNEAEVLSFIKTHYTNNDTLGQATFKLVNSLFAEHNLLILDADQPALKQLFSPVMEKELLTQFSNQQVETTNTQLEQQGLKKQIHSRLINLFYLNEAGKRDRIILDGEGFIIDEKVWSRADLLNTLRSHPERFSPNVVLRPLYQECILPNLAYIGGAGEISYWLQLKGVFEEAGITYPIIQVRNSIQIVEKAVVKKMEKLDLELEELFQPLVELKKNYLFKHSADELDFDSLDEMSAALVNNLKDAIIKVDGGLKGYAESEIVRFQKQLDSVKQKLIRQKKKQAEDAMRQLENMQERLFPEGVLQERKLNAMQFFVQYGKEDFMKMIYSAINPEENRLILLVDE
jgi:bacillithiol biosynthesis cysteine-adding enzyme BshC